jgi:hypothetical protein
MSQYPALTGALTAKREICFKFDQSLAPEGSKMKMIWQRISYEMFLLARNVIIGTEEGYAK